MRQLLEAEAKELAAAAGLVIPAGALAGTVEEAAEVARGLSGKLVVKAQVPAGRRATDGGILFVDAAGVADAAGSLIGRSVRGFRVEKVLVEERVAAGKELYCGLTFSSRLGRPQLLLSRAGGGDVEAHAAVAAQVPFSFLVGLRPWHVWEAARLAGIGPTEGRLLVDAIAAMYRVFRDTEAELVEVNPLILTAEGACVAADVRVVTEHRDSAYPHPDPAEVIRQRYGFDLVELDATGQVGLITTGAGASMMLIDMLTAEGASPINFCDIRSGGFGGDPTRLRFAFDHLAGYPNLRCVAINIFAGVTDLAEVAELLSAILVANPPAVPVVARLEGSGAAQARARVGEAGALCVDSLESLVTAVVAHAGNRGGFPLVGRDR